MLYVFWIKIKIQLLRKHPFFFIKDDLYFHQLFIHFESIARFLEFCSRISSNSRLLVQTISPSFLDVRRVVVEGSSRILERTSLLINRSSTFSQPLPQARGKGVASILYHHIRFLPLWTVFPAYSQIDIYVFLHKDPCMSRCQTFPSMWTLGEDQPVQRTLYDTLLVKPLMS